MNASAHKPFLALMLLALAALVFNGCSEDEEDPAGCEGPELTPHLSPVSFGELYPLGSNEENTATNERVPYEWTLQLLSMCKKDVSIEKICMVGDTEDENGNVIFSFENPPQMKATATDSATVRIRYERSTPNPGDEVDDVALIVRSNDKEHPTMVIAVCARVVADGSEKKTVTCSEVIDSTVDPATLCP